MLAKRPLLLLALALLVGCQSTSEDPDPPIDAAPDPGDRGSADDAAPPDGGPADGSPGDAAMPSDAMPTDAMPDGMPPDGMLPDGMLPDGMSPDGIPPDAGPQPSGDGCEIVPLLQQRCAQGGCHLPQNRRTSLVLTADAIAGGSLLGYVIPFDPDNSYLMQRLTGVGGAPLMPLGSVAPMAEVPRIEAWIADGAPTDCDVPPPPAAYDPNHLDRDALFACDDPERPGATPARLRRIERREWTRAVVKPLSGTWWGSTAKDNPFAAPDRLPYTTHPADVTIDPATLDLYMLVLPEAPALWNARDPRAAPGFIPGTRTAVVYSNPAVRCIFNDAAPDNACIDTYVGTLLRDGVLFRTPTDGEFGRLRGFLVQALADEADPTQRRATLQFVGEAAFLMAGALFRSELGEPVADEPGRHRLTAEEMALALGRVLSAHPVGAPLPIDWAGAPDADAPMLGRLGLLRAAAEDGSIFEPDVIAGLLEAYRGGVDLSRADLAGEEDARSIPSRGEYWLAENILQFFREWLDYEAANTAFKDTPGATSRWDGTYNGDPMYDPSTRGFRNMQTGFYGYEPTLVEHLDDTIARAVIESHQQGEDVFAKLMTTRMWRLPSNLADTNGTPCQARGDCVEAPYTQCTPLGVCGNSIAGNTTMNTRVYNVEADVPATSDGRWVEMPDDQRAGVLTHPAWLAAHGRNFEDDANTVHRGKWIRERLFCETVPGLEFVQAEAQLVPSDPNHSGRERLRRSVEDPETNPQSTICMGCHALMNPLGYPFEIYNHAGFVRAFDHGPEGDIPPDGHSRITLAPDPALQREVRDAIEFSALLADSREARRCFVRQAFRYFAGRDETPADACVLADMEAALDASGSFFDMLEVLVTSRAFQDRQPPEMP